MGGRGSGRHYRWDTKNATDDFRSIDIRRWHREKLLIPGQSFSRQWACDGKETASISVRVDEDKIYLSYRYRSHGEDWADKQYPVYLVWTPCNYGNKRPWFVVSGRLSSF